jgi:hypothetical protein
MASLPSLNLSFEKHTATTQSLTSSNDNSSKNNNTINLNIINPLAETYPLTPPNSPRILTPKAIKDVEPTNNNLSSPRKLKRKNSATSSRKSPIKKELDFFPERLKREIKEKVYDDEDEEEFEIPEPYKSPDFSETEKEFKDQLLSFTTDLLINDFDLLKNLCERGNKIILHQQQLKQLIAILFLNKEDKNKYNEIIEIEVEPIIINSCFCIADCKNPFIQKIKSIYINKSINFLITPYAVNMSTTFRISLELCLKEKVKE